MIRYAIVKDVAEPQFNGVVLPWTSQIADRPQPTVGKGAIRLVLEPWRRHQQAINLDAYRWIMAPHTAWINQDYAPGEDPHAESITGCRNYVSFDDAHNVGNSVLLECFRFDEDPYAEGCEPEKVNWKTRPELFCKIIATSGEIPPKHVINCANGRDAYWPLLRRSDPVYNPLTQKWTGGMWMNLSQLELFPALPCRVTIARWTGALRIRTAPSLTAPIIAGTYNYQRYFAGQAATILEYKLRGCDVWGRTDRGWICLLLNQVPTVPRSFYTDWHLHNENVIPAKVV